MADETYHAVARVGEVAEGSGLYVDVDGRAVALFLDGGTYYALDDCCPHQGAPLSDGLVCDKSVTCSWHGWQFSLEDGRWLDGGKSRVPTHPVRVVGEEIQVGIA